MKNKKKLDKFLTLLGSLLFPIDFVMTFNGRFYFLNDVCKVLKFKDPLKTLSMVGICIESSLLNKNNITRLAYKAKRNNVFEIVIDETDFIKLILMSKDEKALAIEKEFYNNVLPAILHDMPKKEMKARFGNLGLFLYDIQKEKKTI